MLAAGSDVQATSTVRRRNGHHNIYSVDVIYLFDVEQHSRNALMYAAFQRAFNHRASAVGSGQ